MIARSRKMLVLTCFALAAGVWSAYATPYMQPDTFATGDAGWSIQDANGFNVPSSLTVQPSGGSGDGGAYLQAQFPASLSPTEGSVLLQAPSYYAGNYNNNPYTPNVGSLSFDFNSGNVVPNGLALYFYSATTGDTWMYDLTALADANGVNSWNTYIVPFTYSGSWNLVNGGSADSATFSASLGNVGWIGTLVDMSPIPGGGPANASLDNFGPIAAPVPEPGTIYMISAVLLSLGMTFKAQVKGFLGRFRSSARA